MVVVAITVIRFYFLISFKLNIVQYFLSRKKEYIFCDTNSKFLEHLKPTFTAWAGFMAYTTYHVLKMKEPATQQVGLVFLSLAQAL